MVQEAAFAFFESQISHIERRAYFRQYQEIQYRDLLPIDTSPPEWVDSITHYSADFTGDAEWFNAMADRVPFVEVSREQHIVPVELGVTGYQYTVAELQRAMMVSGTDLRGERVMAARRSVEEFNENVAFHGSTELGWDGFLNHSRVNSQMAANNAAGDSREWANKTALEIVEDINGILNRIVVDTRKRELADHLLLPVSAHTELANKVLPNTGMNVLEYIRQNNIFTQMTRRELVIQSVLGLEDAGAGDTGRAIAYRKDPEALKLYMPMPHRFLPVFIKPPGLVFQVAGLFSLGGLEIRLPRSMQYLDGITA